MYEKGENLYNFEHDRFMFLKKWIDCKNIDIHAKDILQEADAIASKYSIDEYSEYVCYKEMLCCLSSINRKAYGF